MRHSHSAAGLWFAYHMLEAHGALFVKSDELLVSGHRARPRRKTKHERALCSGRESVDAAHEVVCNPAPDCTLVLLLLTKKRPPNQNVNKMTSLANDWVNLMNICTHMKFYSESTVNKMTEFIK